MCWTCVIIIIICFGFSKEKNSETQKKISLMSACLRWRVNKSCSKYRCAASRQWLDSGMTTCLRHDLEQGRVPSKISLVRPLRKAPADSHWIHLYPLSRRQKDVRGECLVEKKPLWLQGVVAVSPLSNSHSYACLPNPSVPEVYRPDPTLWKRAAIYTLLERAWDNCSTSMVRIFRLSTSPCSPISVWRFSVLR